MKRPVDILVIPSLILLACSLIPHPSLAQAEDPYAYEDEYQAGDFGRVSYQENGVTIHRAFADPGMPPVTEGGVNSPVYPGDALLTDGDQRVEVQVAGGSLIRIDRATDVTFLSLPDPYAEFQDNTVLQLAEGTLQIAARLAEGEEFRVDTPSSSIYLLGDGDFRIEVTPGGRTEVISRSGVAEVVGNGGSILVRGGMRTEVFSGSLPEEAWAFNTFVTDPFDRWVDERDAVYLVRDRYPGAQEYSAETYQALPAEVRPYYQELSYHGDWTYVEEYGYVWHPSEVASGWRPYYDGYWDYGPGGYFWVSYEPWGWAPYHYGRWNWVAGFGWCWIPGRVFAGAWVAWSWGPVYVGWSPIDFWGRPCLVREVYYGYYDPHAWTFVDYAYVGHRNYHRHAVRVDSIGPEIRHARVVARAPRVSPTRLASSREERARAMRLAEDDRAARMRPYDRNSRSLATLNEVERRIRGKEAVRRSDDRARAAAASRRGSNGTPSGDGRATARGGKFPGYPSRVSQGRRAGDAAGRNSSSVRRDSRTPGRASGGVDAGSPTASPRVRPRETERAGTDQRVRDLYRKMASPRSTREDGSTTVRRQPTTSSREQRSTRRSQRTTSGSDSRSKAQPRTGQRTSPRPGTAPSRQRTTDRKQTDRSSPGTNGGSGKRTTDRKRDGGSGATPGTNARSSAGPTSSRTTRPRPTTGATSQRTTRPRPTARTTSPSRPTPRTVRSPSPSRPAPSRSTGTRSAPSRSGGSSTRSSPSRSKSGSGGKSKSRSNDRGKQR
jgi:hypothetical protein